MKKWYEGENIVVSIGASLPPGIGYREPVSVSLELDECPMYVRSIERGRLLTFQFVDGVLSFVAEAEEFLMYEIGFSAEGFIAETAREILEEYKDAFLELAK